MKINKTNLKEILNDKVFNDTTNGTFDVIGETDRFFSEIAPVIDAGFDAISWVNSTRGDAVELAQNCSAGILVVPLKLGTRPASGQTFICASNPKLIFTLIVRRCLEKVHGVGIHETAVIDEEAILSEKIKVGAHTLIGKCVVGAGTTIGDNCTILDGTKIGENVSIASGTRIGANGFGYAKNSNGEHILFPHIGGVDIRDNVEIGANSCIDRGSLSDTIIHAGVKIDNLVHISHNVEIFENVIVVALSFIGGSVSIGANAFIGASSTIRDTVQVGHGSFVGMGSTVTKSVPPNETWWPPARPARKIN